MGARATWAASAAVLLGLAGFAAPAGAFTMAEQMATTGVQGTLAKTSAPGASGTIGSVKNKLAVSAPKAPSLPAGGRAAAKRPGAGSGKRGKKAASSGSGWGEATKGWGKSGAASGKGGGTWVNADGGWAESSGWPSAKDSKAWAESGSSGAWARPGKKS
jgi:hypothetical protein